MSRILVVDDQEDIRLLLRIELSADGHQITEAGDGEAALAAIARTLQFGGPSVQEQKRFF